MRALADTTRLRIVHLLLGHEELCVCELTSAMEIVQPKVSRHLAILREAGLVLDRREGLWIHYRIHPDLPVWVTHLLKAVHEGCQTTPPYTDDLRRLEKLDINTRASCHT